MRNELWREVESIFTAAIDLPEAERLAFVIRVGANSEVRAEVESLLAVYARAQTFLSAPERPAAGRRYGSYRLTRELGHGGMGTVFLAERDDDQFHKRVAVKLINTSPHNPVALHHFRTERQVLATLEHPNIARLLDSGISQDGLPYIVMEYIEGVPITEFCRGLPLERRLELFQRVCLAAHFAHQHLVVHRDLKPGNILVTSEGVPKLLDFGIAKMLDPSNGTAADPTVTILQPLTLDYASPEQLRGDVVSTASDVYSLGVLLFELATGELPHDFREKTLQEAAETISSREPRAPAGLATDLIYIIRKAMGPHLQERYASASELAADIECFLKQRPVLARRGNFRYVGWKFVARNRAAVAAGLTAVLLVLAGAIALVHSSRIAETERAKAQERFDQVRRLADSLVFEIHDGIATLPGSTPARRMLVARALQYLESLEKASSGDAGLELELAQSYTRLGSVQGLATQSNLGDPQGALASYGRAAEVLHRLLASSPGRPDVLRQLSWVHLYRGNVYLYLRKTSERDREYGAALAIIEPLAGRFPDDDRVGDAHAAVLFSLADSLAESDSERALRIYLECLHLYDKLLEAHPESPAYRRNVALVHKYVANLIPSTAEAMDHLVRAVALDEQRVAAQPNDAAARMDLSFGLSDVGWRLEKSGDLSRALEKYESVLHIREGLAAADPRDAQIRTRVIFARKRIAGVLLKMNRLNGARIQYAAALELARTAVTVAGGDRWNLAYLGELEIGLAETEQQIASRSPASGGASEHRRKSCEAYRRALDVLKKLVDNGGARVAEREESEAAARAVAACGGR